MRLGDAADMLIGFAFKSSGFLDASSEGVKLVRGDNVQQGSIRWGDKTKRWSLTELDGLEKYQLAEDDVVLAMDRPVVGNGLKVAWVQPRDLPAMLVQRVCRLRGKEGVAETKYIRYVLAAPEFSAHIQAVTTGANIPHISRKDIAAYEFDMPTLDEQRQIVAVLSAYDDLIATNQRRIALLEEASRRLYREWFVRLRFPGHEAVDLVDGVPEGWARKTLGEIAPLKYGKALKATERKDGRIPVYGSSGVVGHHDHAFVDAGAIVVGRKGNVGSLYFSHEPCFPIDTVFFIAPDASTFYLLQALSNLNFISSDAAVPGLNRNYAHSLQLLVPDGEVAAAFETLVEPLYSQAFQLERQKKQLAKARDALLPKLMSG